MDSIIAALLEHAARAPDRACVAYEGATLSYGEVCARAARFAHAARAWGVQPGDRVALFLENSLEFLDAYLGTGLAGGVAVLVNSHYRQTELRHILADSGARLCVTAPAQRAELERVRPDVPALHRVVIAGVNWREFLGAADAVDGIPDAPHPEAPAVVAYTSGTTGRSKGAVLRHRNLAANARAVTDAWQWSERDNLLLVLPLFHGHGLLVGLSGTLLSGARCELQRAFHAPSAMDRLCAGGVSMFFGVPTMYTRLIDEARARGIRPPPIRLYVSGSAPLNPDTFEDFERLFGQRILERYGMTETLMNLTNPYDGERRPGTVGLPFPGQEARIVDLRSRQPLPPGHVGEIEVRGPHVFQGYLNQPEATAQCFTADGWFRTGDLGQVSADGYYTITGRARELIITGGYNVYPREVEDVLRRCPGVREAAVFGMPDPEFGEHVCAAIVRADPLLSEADVIAFCRDQLAGYKKPRRILFVETLPRNALGKVVKHEIQKRIQA